MQSFPSGAIPFMKSTEELIPSPIDVLSKSGTTLQSIADMKSLLPLKQYESQWVRIDPFAHCWQANSLSALQPSWDRILIDLLMTSAVQN
jgi:hypothetical protein